MDALPQSTVCPSTQGSQLVRLAITSKDLQQGSGTLTLTSVTNGAASSIPRIGNTWAAPVAVNQTYRLEWTGSQLHFFYLEVFPLAPSASVTLEVGVSNTTDQIQVETADQSLQLGQHFPASPEASAATYDANRRTLSLLLFGSSRNQTQVCTYQEEELIFVPSSLSYGFISPLEITLHQLPLHGLKKLFVQFKSRICQALQ